MVIEGDLRLPLLTLEWIFAILAVELALVFLIKWARQDSQLRTKQELGYMALFTGLALNWFLLILADYYMADTITTPFFIWSAGSMQGLFINLGSFCLMLGMLTFSFTIEKYRRFLVRKYFFTMCVSLLVGGAIIAFLINLESYIITTLIQWVLLLVFLGIYYVDLFQKSLRTKSPVLDLFKFIPAFLIIAVGVFCATQFGITPLNYTLRFTGSIIQLIAIIVITFFSIKLPALAEYDWKEKIEELYLINNAGICLLHRNFSGKIDTIDEHLKAGAITSINIILQSLTPSQKTRTSIIEKKGKILTIYSGSFSSGVIISTEELRPITYHLKEFIQKFEAIYADMLLDWRGDTDIFVPVDAMVNQFFA
jgi:hypothetical protein